MSKNTQIMQLGNEINQVKTELQDILEISPRNQEKIKTLQSTVN